MLIVCRFMADCSAQLVSWNIADKCNDKSCNVARNESSQCCEDKYDEWLMCNDQYAYCCHYDIKYDCEHSSHQGC